MRGILVNGLSTVEGIEQFLRKIDEKKEERRDNRRCNENRRR